MEFAGAQAEVHLRATVKQIGEEHNYTALIPNMDGVDPDDSFSRIPYEKGFYFLYYLQTQVGGSDKFMPFFKKYIQENAYKIVTSELFQKMFCEEFPEQGATVDWDTWLNKPGFPPVTNQYNDTLGDASRSLAAKWDEAGDDGVGSASDMDGWSCKQKIYFLEVLNEKRQGKPMAASAVTKMGEMFGFTDTRNCEIRALFYQLAFHAQVEGSIEWVCKFSTEQGRMKYVRPMYKMLFQSGREDAKQAALTAFQENRTSYHPIAAKMLAQDLNLSSA